MYRLAAALISLSWIAEAEIALAGCITCSTLEQCTLELGPSYACVYDPNWETSCCLLVDAGIPDSGPPDVSSCEVSCESNAYCAEVLGREYICELNCCVRNDAPQDAGQCSVTCESTSYCEEVLGSRYSCDRNNCCVAEGSAFDAGGPSCEIRCDGDEICVVRIGSEYFCSDGCCAFGGAGNDDGGRGENPRADSGGGNNNNGGGGGAIVRGGTRQQRRGCDCNAQPSGAGASMWIAVLLILRVGAPKLRSRDR